MEEKQTYLYSMTIRLEIMSLELDYSYPSSRIKVLENALSIDDICVEVFHPNNGGIKNLLEKICHNR